MKKNLNIIMKPCYMQTNYFVIMRFQCLYASPICRQEGIIIVNIPDMCTPISVKGSPMKYDRCTIHASKPVVHYGRAFCIREFSPVHVDWKNGDHLKLKFV